MFLRHKDREHLITFHARPHLDITYVSQIFFQLLEEARAQFTVGHLASAKPDSGFHLVAARQPLARMLHAIAVVMQVRAGTKLHFLNSDDDLLLLGLVCFLFLLVLKLAEVDDFANRRIGIRRNFHQIHAPFTGHANRFACVHDAELLAIFSSYAHLRHANPFVDSSDRRATKIRPSASTKTCSYGSTSWVK